MNLSISSLPSGYPPVQASPVFQTMRPETAQRHAEQVPFGLHALESDVCVLGHISARWPNTHIERECRCACHVLTQYPDDIRGYISNLAPFWPETIPHTPPPMTTEKEKDEMLSVINTVLASRYFRYLARELEWLLEDEYSNAMYQLQPSEYNMQQLINALSETSLNASGSAQETSDLHTLVTGSVQPGAGQLSALRVDKIRQVDPVKMADHIGYFHQQNQQAAMTQVINNYLLLAKNAGMADEERALNYLLCYGNGFYNKLYEQRLKNQQQSVHLVGIDSRLHYAGERTLVYVVFNYQDQKTSVIESWSSTLDVTNEYPFMVSEFEPYINVF